MTIHITNEWPPHSVQFSPLSLSLSTTLGVRSFRYGGSSLGIRDSRDLSRFPNRGRGTTLSNSRDPSRSWRAGEVPTLRLTVNLSQFESMLDSIEKFDILLLLSESETSVSLSQLQTKLRNLTNFILLRGVKEVKLSLTQTKKIWLE